MADVIEQTEKKEESVVVDDAAKFDPFDESTWKGVPIEEVKKEEEVKTIPVVTEEKKEEEVIDGTEYLKRIGGWDSEDAAKAELEELRKLREAPKTEELKFANDESKKLFEYLKEGKEDDVYSLLDRKRKLSTVDKLSSAEALKLHIAQLNSHYSVEDVKDVFEEKYAIPDKPVQEIDETDDEFVLRENSWKSQVEKVNRKIERDAFTAKQELAKLQSELILPDISKKEEAKSIESSQEELQKIETIRNAYLKSLDTDYKNFTGHEITYKDEEVEIPLSFGVTEEDKVALRDEFKSFDVDGFITGRWFNADGSPNIKQQMEDVHLLRNKMVVLQKLVNEAGAQRLAQYIKAKSAVVVDNPGSNKIGQNPADGKPAMEKLSDAIWAV